MRFCAILDSNRDVYHDAASESGVGCYTDDLVSRTGIPSVLLLTGIKNDPGPEFNSSGVVPCLFKYRSLPDYARSTRPDFRQDVQTYIFLDPPSVLTLTDFTFDFHIVGVFL